jgi:hypothetical protein
LMMSLSPSRSMDLTSIISRPSRVNIFIYKV